MLKLLLLLLVLVMRFVQGGEPLLGEEGMAGDQAIVGIVIGGGSSDNVSGIVAIVVVEEV